MSAAGQGRAVGAQMRLQSFQDSRDAFHPFRDPVSRRSHQGNAEVSLSTFAKADAGGYHHSFPLDQQLGHLRG